MSMEILADTLNRIQCDIQAIRDEARVSHNDICTKFDDFKSRFDYLEKRVDILSEKDNIANLELRAIKSDMNTLKQKSLELNIVAKGVPELSGESNIQTQQIISQLLAILAVDDDNVSKSAKRIGKRTNDTPRMILFKVNKLEQKADIISAKRMKTITANMISVGNVAVGSAGDTVYVDDHLTPTTVHLLKQARELRSLGVKHVWTKNGTILVKMNDKSDPTIVRNEQDICNLRQSLTRKRKHINVDGTGRNNIDNTNDELEQQRSKVIKPTSFGATSTITTRSKGMQT